MNNLLNPTSQTHPTQRKKLAHIKEVQKRNKKAREYIEPSYLPKVKVRLNKFFNK